MMNRKGSWTGEEMTMEDDTIRCSDPWRGSEARLESILIEEEEKTQSMPSHSNNCGRSDRDETMNCTKLMLHLSPDSTSDTTSLSTLAQSRIFGSRCSLALDMRLHSKRLYCTLLLLVTQLSCLYMHSINGLSLYQTSDHDRPPEHLLDILPTSTHNRYTTLEQQQQQQQKQQHRHYHHHYHSPHSIHHNSRKRLHRSSLVGLQSADPFFTALNLSGSNTTTTLHNTITSLNDLLTGQYTPPNSNSTKTNDSLRTDDTGNGSLSKALQTASSSLLTIQKNPINNNASATTMLEGDTSFMEEDGERSLVVTSSIVANSIIFIIGLCGNLVVILVILKFTRVETVTDIYILNLAFADLMFIAGLFFLVITMYLGEWIFGHTMCKIYMATTSLNQFASSLLLVIMSFDRFLAVCHPIYAQQFRSPRRAKIICMIIWIICLTLMLPIFIFAKAQDGASCSIHWPEYPSFNCEVAFTLYSFAIGFAVPLSLIACFYVCVIRKLRHAASEPITMSRSSRRSRARESTNKRIEHLVIAIIFTYTICWLPYWITQLYVSFTTNNEDQQPVQGFYEFFLLATSLTYTNSALNPILYAFLSDNFKRRFSDILRSIYSIKWCQEEIVTETHSTVMSALA